MRPVLFFFVFFISTQASFGQTVEETHPKTLWCPNDTFVLTFKNYPKEFPYKVSREDKESPGRMQSRTNTPLFIMAATAYV
jgi:hypothetical protein